MATAGRCVRGNIGEKRRFCYWDKKVRGKTGERENRWKGTGQRETGEREQGAGKEKREREREREGKEWICWSSGLLEKWSYRRTDKTRNTVFILWRHLLNSSDRLFSRTFLSAVAGLNPNCFSITSMGYPFSPPSFFGSFPAPLFLLSCFPLTCFPFHLFPLSPISLSPFCPSSKNVFSHLYSLSRTCLLWPCLTRFILTYCLLNMVVHSSPLPI